MNIGILQDGKIVSHGHYRDLFPDTSFSEQGPSSEFLQEHNCKIVNYFKPHDGNSQKLVVVQPYIEDDQIYAVEVQPITEQEQQGRTTAKANEVRNQRNNLISASDWTQLADSPADKAAWATYRQALRDIPQQEGFPLNVMWPTPPA
jgi:hypothetical protein